jgi:hypothetical protein
MPLRRILVPAALAAVVALPAAASASTVSSTGAVISFVDAPGGRADLAASYTPRPVQLVDAGGPLAAAGLCVAGSPVTCPGTEITADLGDRADIAKLSSLDRVTVDAGRGDDQVFAWGAGAGVTAGPGDDLAIVDANGTGTLRGGSGDDRLVGRGSGTDVDGGPGADFVVTDALRVVSATGGAGPDTMVGYNRGTGGSLSGGSGRDVLVLANVPPFNIGPWAISGGGGADTIDVSGDGSIADTITCGAGRDRVIADPSDVVAPDCELVTIGTAAPGSVTAIAAVDGLALRAAALAMPIAALQPGPFGF